MKHLTAEQVQDRLGIRRPTLYSWVRQGKLHPVRAGRGLLFEEDEVLKLLGYGTTVSVWMGGGGAEAAKRRVREEIRRGARAYLRLQYLSAPTPDFVRGRIISTGGGEPVEEPGPGGLVFDALVDAKKTGKYLFLGSDESVWRIHDVRPEVSPSGEAYIALELAPVRAEEARSQRETRVREILQRMEQGLIVGRLAAYKREDLYGRRAR